MTVYRCQDSLDSIFTAIYLAYEEKRDHMDTYISLTEDPVLFAEDVYVTPDWEKMNKVMRSLYRFFGEKDYMSLCLALASQDEGKAQAVYRTVVDGLSARRGAGHLFDDLANDEVHHAFLLARLAGRELDHLRGFLRFRELENGVLYAKITPRNNVAAFLMPHFADRLPQEDFMIQDERRGIYAIHPAGKQWYLFYGGEQEDDPAFGISAQEREYQELFQYFCHKIAIEERKNLKLQQNMLPLRFRKNMTEFRDDK
ncbi:MAG: TIGR03915 family putative DNA repair protein [Lachnospiraceae bacterium]|nr:TIGR03915 family putative DNA repair protein [Lachnospiraceae bacterium]MCM1238012.1 TIGR03915 family putative DNA repair protein [Lachnospiraceae bacterium]MCM1302523.1 TIGR03915 family putative DNA repair protein [Butyrivibrio sp.]MCM1342349.1 TIGR03915 family putative DNA repair protein [Muribaculaceae bacterium]MCM1410884.1 TIGR03915 family putative DNA repair protein [Lachnospiraceae bacterium]